MNNISYKTGYIAAVTLAVSFAAWIVCFTGIALTSPLFRWTNLADYIAFINSNSQIFKNTAMIFMLITGPAYVLLINGFYNIVSEKNRALVRISLSFALAFAVLSCLNYFVQLSAVRLNIEHGQTEGLEMFIQANPNSVITAANMLGWTLFLGLSSLFIFPVFQNTKLQRIIKIAFIVNGISCLLAGTGYVLQIDIVTFVFVNLGTGGALMIISVCSAVLFRKIIKDNL